MRTLAPNLLLRYYLQVTSRARWAIRIGIAALSLLFVLTLFVWYATRSRLLDEKPYTPKLSEADLPPLVEPELNGWWSIARMALSTIDAVAPVESILDTQTPPEKVPSLRQQRATLEAFSVPEEVRRRLDEAYSAPRFVIDCSFELDARAPCPEMQTVAAHRIALTLAAQDALGSDTAAALHRMLRLYRASHDAVITARTLVSAVGSGICVRETTRVTLLILEHLEHEQQQSELRPALDALQNELALPGPKTWTPEASIVGEFLGFRNAIVDLKGGFMPIRTNRLLKLLDEYHQAVIAYAQGSRPTAPSPPRTSRLDKLLDPDGSLLLDTLSLESGIVVEKMRHQLAAAQDDVQRSKAVLARLIEPGSEVGLDSERAREEH